MHIDFLQCFVLLSPHSEAVVDKGLFFFEVTTDVDYATFVVILMVGRW